MGILVRGGGLGPATKHNNTINTNTMVRTKLQAMLMLMILIARVIILSKIKINMMIKILRKVRNSNRKCTRNLIREYMISRIKLEK